jgi:NADH-quinone oxidoreductase subunit L
MVGVVAAALTAFYMFRLYWMTFWGKFRGTEEQAAHLHESPATMTLPLMVLALGSLVAGAAGWPTILGGGAWFEHFLHPVMADAHHAMEQVFREAVPGHDTELALMGVSILVALAGIGLATVLYYKRPELTDRLAAAFSGPHRLLLNKYYVDELYGALFVRGAALGGGRALFGVDRFAIDGGDGEVRRGGGVNGLAWLVRDLIAKASNVWDKYVVDGAVNLTGYTLDNASYVFRTVQNGLVQQYALTMLIALLLLFGGWLMLPLLMG